jgi:pentapeptide repeat protein
MLPCSVAALRRGMRGGRNNEVPDLSRAGLRGLDLTGFDLSGADLRSADLRGTKLCDADLSGARLQGANFFKAVLDGADLAKAYLDGAEFLNCASSSLLGTGNRPSVMKRLPAAPLFRTGSLQNRFVAPRAGDSPCGF